MVRTGAARRMTLWLSCCLLTACAGTSDETPTATADSSIPRYVERAAEVGLDFTFRADSDLVVGGGAAAFDCDGTGGLDLAVAGGLGPLGLFRNTARAPRPGETRPTPAFEAVDLSRDAGPDAGRGATGVYALDIDNDTHTDLVITRFGANLVLQGLPDCRFRDVTELWGLSDTGTWTTSFAANWIGGSPHPTLVFGNYVRRDRPLQKTGNCEPVVIARPDPSSGVPDYRTKHRIDPSHCALSMAFVDWRGDGTPDLWISNDREYADPDGGEQLVRVTETDVRIYGALDGWVADRIWGMGLAVADVTGDGRPEVAATSMAENRLYVIDSAATAPAFRDEAWTRGTAAQRPHTGGDPRPSTSWHAEFADLNNDLVDDLLIVKGNVADMKQFAAFDPDSLLLGNGDGTFREVGAEAGLALRTTGRGAAVFDADLDGCLDLVVVNRNQPLSFFHAVSCGTQAGVASIALSQSGRNPDAIGATLSATDGTHTLRRTLSVGGGHGGSGLTPIPVALPSSAGTRVTVRWPDGWVSGPALIERPGLYHWRDDLPAPKHRGQPFERSVEQ